MTPGVQEITDKNLSVMNVLGLLVWRGPYEAIKRLVALKVSVSPLVLSRLLQKLLRLLRKLLRVLRKSLQLLQLQSTN